MAQVLGETVKVDRITVIRQLEEFGNIRRNKIRAKINQVQDIYAQKFKAVANVLTESDARNINQKILHVSAKLIDIEKSVISLRDSAREELNKTPPPNGIISIDKKILERNSSAMEALWDRFYGANIELFCLIVGGLQESIETNNRDLALQFDDRLGKNTALEDLKSLERFTDEAKSYLDTVIKAPSV